MEDTRYKILLIEDDELDQMAFKRMVEERELSYNCITAASVAEARKMLADDEFDIVISDYALGDGTAFDVLDLIKDCPVILVTGAGNEEVATNAWKAGAYDYLVKDHEGNYLKNVSITVENAIRHKRMEAKLRLLSHAIVGTTDSVYITDLEDKITFVNNAFCETYGYTEEEIIGQDCDILWNKARSASDKEDNQQAVSGWEVGFYHKRKDGSEFPVSLTRSNVKDENSCEVAHVIIAHDMSERMQIENELRITNRDLQKENQLRRQLAATVCLELAKQIDELKDIVSAALAEQFGKISTKLQKNLQSADQSIDKAAEIVRDFVEVSQIGATETKTQLTELTLRSVVSQVLKALAPLADQKGIDLKSTIPDSELAIDANWDRIVRVLTKLVKKMTKKVSVK